MGFVGICMFIFFIKCVIINMIIGQLLFEIVYVYNFKFVKFVIF